MEPVILITGAGRGIGAATALLAAKNGYRVAVNYIHHARRANAVVEAIRARGGQAIAIGADVRVESQVVEMFQTVDQQLGTLAALVNNAGVLAPLARVESFDANRIKRIFETNVMGSFLCAREAILRMSTRKGGAGGSIVNLTSGAARLGAANEYIDYAASKGAIDTFTVGLAKEVADDGIRVNAVRAGFIATEMHRSVGGKARLESLRHTIALGRAGQPEEIAEAILWLLSERASYCTGTILDATGGR